MQGHALRLIALEEMRKRTSFVFLLSISHGVSFACELHKLLSDISGCNVCCSVVFVCIFTSTFL